MLTPRTRAATVLKRPVAFAIRVLKGFRANQGYLLAGAVAYNTLLSILPLLILILIVLANFVDETALLTMLDRYLDLVVPGQSEAIMSELGLFLEHRHVIGWVLVATLLFFGGASSPFGHLFPDFSSPILAAIVPILWFVVKVLGFLLLFIWVRGTLPRFRYDQLMSFGWKFLLPVAMANIIITSLVMALHS